MDIRPPLARAKRSSPRVRRLPWCVVLVALLTPAIARSQLYEFEWNGRWARGGFTYNHDAVDSDPDPTRGVYDGVIYDFHFGGYNMPSYHRLHLGEGHGGSIVVQAQSGTTDFAGTCVAGPCTPFSVSIFFGADTTGAPAQYRMELRGAPFLPPERSFGDGLPPEGIHWGYGDVFNDRTDLVVSGIGWNMSVSNAPFSGTVPEPGTWVLFGIGVTALAVLRKRPGTLLASR